jgi:hypothetical protein
MHDPDVAGNDHLVTWIRDAVVITLLVGSCVSCARPAGPADLAEAKDAVDGQIHQMQLDLAPTTFTPRMPTEGDGGSSCRSFWTGKSYGTQSVQASYAGRPPSVRDALDHLDQLWQQRGYQPIWIDSGLHATTSDGLRIGAYPQGPDHAELALGVSSQCVPPR